ncbi:MAG: hypothetical protein IIU14_07775 [Ruminococcus sp.]|nr:hypothetical protein [Ruminococcus sp.]
MKKLISIALSVLILSASLIVGVTVASADDNEPKYRVGDAVHELVYGWEYGAINPDNGFDTADSPKIYARTDFINVQSFGSVVVELIDPDCAYNVIFYNKDKKRVSALTDWTFLSTSGEFDNNACYARVVCYSKKGLNLDALFDGQRVVLKGKNGLFSLKEDSFAKGSPFYSWEVGSIDTEDGEERDDPSGLYFRTNLIKTDGISAVRAAVLNGTYRYNICFYDKNRKFISALQKEETPTINLTRAYKIKDGAEYVRLVVYRSEEKGGILLSKLEAGFNICFSAYDESLGASKTTDISWEKGRFVATSGKPKDETTGRYYRTDYISLENYNVVKAFVFDPNYRYNIFFYDSEKNFISALESVNPPTICLSDLIDVPFSAAYLRILVCRSKNLGGVLEEDLYSDKWIYFELDFDGAVTGYTEPAVEPEEPTAAPTESTAPATAKAEEPTALTSTESQSPTASESTAVTEPTSSGATEPTQPTEPSESPKTEKKKNTLKVTAKTVKVKVNKLKRKAQKVKPLTVKKAKGKLSFKLIKKNSSKKLFKMLSINNKGVITIKRSVFKKGVYKVRVRIIAKGNSSYLSKTIYKTIKLKLK